MKKTFVTKTLCVLMVAVFATVAVPFTFISTFAENELGVPTPMDIWDDQKV